MAGARLNRRQFLCRSCPMGMAAVYAPELFGQGVRELQVACAGSFRPMAEGPLTEGALKALHLALKVHAEGADAVAHALVEGSLRADVFVPITATPMLSVMRAGLTRTAIPVARTEMVLVYSPKGPFAARFAAAATDESAWWKILQEPGLRFGRSDPRADPGGRNIIFTLMLAAQQYRQPNLVKQVLGDPLNPEQVSAAGNALSRLQAGDLDASGAYKVSAVAAHLPYLTLPPSVNLSGLTVHADHPEVQFTLGAETYTPDPLVFYASVLKSGFNTAGAEAFVQWLQQSGTQALLQANGFSAAGEAGALTV